MDLELKKNIGHIKKIIKIGLKEDLKNNKDITSEAIFSDEIGRYQIISKGEGILCGIEVAKLVFKILDKKIKFLYQKEDKEKIFFDEIILEFEGKIISLLKAERTALNFLGYLSGIATKTSSFVNLTKGYTKILDTRKILAGYRLLSKYAVRCGGGINHRFGLYDMILIKDNHIDAAKSIKNAVEKVRKRYNHKYKIEVETRTIEEVKEALECKVDRIMLDNMDIDTLKLALEIIDNKVETEISGNVKEDNIEMLSQLRPTYISIGALTHSMKNFDFSMRIFK